MARIRPFRGLRYAESAGALESLVAPPYDVISPEQREALAGKNPVNVVHLTLPEQEADDRSKFVKYARSAARLEAWRRQSVMQLEDQPAFYRTRQTFTIPGTPQSFTRTVFIALLRVEPYENGVVLPHEFTFPKHKEDRLRILEATRSHLECIFGLYEDHDRAVYDLVDTAPVEALGELTTEDGIHHTWERIVHPQVVEALQNALADKKLWIADGHHRYETAQAFRNQLGERSAEVAEDYMMMAFGSMNDPGLVLLPTHRMLKRMPMSIEEFRAAVATHFQVEEVANPELSQRLAQATPGQAVFGVALPGGQGLLLTSDTPQALAERIPGEGSLALKSLDVSLLHGVLFGEILGLSGVDFFDYTRDEAEALAAVDHGSPAAFLMNPPTVDDMRTIALGGERMPQKSTFYYPKILSGLVLWSLKDFEE